VVADSLHFDEKQKQNPDPDPHQSEKTDPELAKLK
jgi:hypothetical protein